ncbi:MAG: hypothetical protein P8J32_05955 [bacterium]|nr:hypothetical protein [bacterium]
MAAKQEINIEELVGKVYFQVARWHNDAHEFEAEQNKVRLQATSFEIIKTVLSEIGINLDDKEVEGSKKTDKDIQVEKNQTKVSEIAARLKKEGLI